jgi:hypothetical protein
MAMKVAADILQGKNAEMIAADADQTVVEARRVMVGKTIGANLLEKDREIKDLNELVGWDYYENWRWHPSRQ